MGETPCPGCPPPGSCCLDLHDTVVLLVALSVLVQVSLKIAAAVGAHLWRLLKGLGRSLQPKASPSPPPGAAIRKSYCPLHPPTARPPRDQRSPVRDLVLPRPCPLCPERSPRLTMDVHLHQDPPRPHPKALGPYHNCTCPRAASAPSALRCDTSPKPRPASVSRGTDPARPAPGVRFRPSRREEPASSGSESRRPRPTKVYIYPVHPATPPTSRDPSPGRRGPCHKEGVGTTQSREAATNTRDGATEMVPPGSRPQYYQALEPSMADWVYRPIKGPQWDWKQGG